MTATLLGVTRPAVLRAVQAKRTAGPLAFSGERRRVHCAHLRALTARTMTAATSAGCVARTACEASISVISLPARLAMSRSAWGWMAWSAVATTAQDGRVFQAGVPLTEVAKQASDA